MNFPTHDAQIIDKNWRITENCKLHKAPWMLPEIERPSNTGHWERPIYDISFNQWIVMRKPDAKPKDYWVTRSAIKEDIGPIICEQLWMKYIRWQLSLRDNKPNIGFIKWIRQQTIYDLHHRYEYDFLCDLLQDQGCGTQIRTYDRMIDYLTSHDAVNEAIDAAEALYIRYWLWAC